MTFLGEIRSLNYIIMSQWILLRLVTSWKSHPTSWWIFISIATLISSHDLNCYFHGIAIGKLLYHELYLIRIFWQICCVTFAYKIIWYLLLKVHLYLSNWIHKGVLSIGNSRSQELLTFSLKSDCMSRVNILDKQKLKCIQVETQLS